MKPAQVRKALVAVATGVTQAISLGLLEGDVEKVVLCVLAALGAYGVYAVENEPLD